ncbi:MAG: hypothetical protein P5681_05770 [Limnospira sp. PMC 894.15]|nr:hypothetical protein [Limnospira sp. PMC 894.15]MDT9187309.1 hypothetical protein [Limnospira sp. PMC 894.15]
MDKYLTNKTDSRWYNPIRQTHKVLEMKKQSCLAIFVALLIAATGFCAAQPAQARGMRGLGRATARSAQYGARTGDWDPFLIFIGLTGAVAVIKSLGNSKN